MKRFTLALALLFSTQAFAHSVVPSNTFKFGDGAASNKTILLNTGAGSLNPKLRWNNSLSKIQGSNDGTNYFSLNLGTDIDSGAATLGQVLSADGSGGTTWATSAAAPDSSYEISGLGILTSVGSNNLTLSTRQKDGTSALSVGNPAKIGFRSATLTSGGYAQATITATQTLVVPSGATLGSADAVARYGYLIEQYNAGSPELCVAGSARFDEGTRHTTVTIGTGSDLASVIYCATGRSDQPIRIIGRFLSTQTTAGTWAAAPSEVSVVPFDTKRNTGWVLNNFFTPSTGFGTGVSNVEVFTKCHDDSLSIRAHLTAGTVTATQAYIFLPPEYRFDITKLPTNTVDRTAIVGRWSTTRAATTSVNDDAEGPIFIDKDETDTLYFAWRTSSSTFQADAVNSFVGDNQNFAFEVHDLPVLNCGL